jgi:antitoxin component YwqK of YwqJK toxin-antitoxin module
VSTSSRWQPARRRVRPSRGGIAVIVSLVAAALSACKTGIVHEVIEYVTTPCPFGTKQVVSKETGTPGLKKLTEKWCQIEDAHGDPIRHGPYLELYDSGTKQEVGQYRNGRRDGTWKRWHPNGRVEAITIYEEGKLQGIAAWHDNGQKWEEGHFEDGFRQGAWIRWHSNGQKEVEGYYVHGVLERLYTMWHDNGQKEQQGEYKNGIRQGLWTSWHRNGQKRSEILYRNGKVDDWYRAWHENGQQAEQALFHDGKPEGSYTIWHDNGQKEEEGTYHDGVLDGQVTAWDKDGQVWMKTEYKGGSLVDEPAHDPLADANPSQPPAPVK